jgi:predicted ATP-binding protein involved in virulence
MYIAMNRFKVARDRTALNRAYDQYVARHGTLNRPRQSSAAAAFMQDDPAYPLLQGLEVEESRVKELERLLFLQKKSEQQMNETSSGAGDMLDSMSNMNSFEQVPLRLYIFTFIYSMRFFL